MSRNLFLNSSTCQSFWRTRIVSSKCGLNPLHAKFFQREQNHILTFYVIPPIWHGTGSWNPSSSKTRTYLFYIINIMGADAMATQGARAAATMILTMLNRISLVPALKGINYCINFILNVLMEPLIMYLHLFSLILILFILLQSICKYYSIWPSCTTVLQNLTFTWPCVLPNFTSGTYVAEFDLYLTFVL